MTSPSNSINSRNDSAVPAAYRRVGVPAGSDVRIRAKHNGTPSMLVVEDAGGADLLKIGVTADGRLDAEYDESRLTEAAERFIVEVLSLLHTGPAGARIRVRADDPPERRTSPP